MRTLLFLTATAAWAVELTPAIVRQGETVRVTASAGAAAVRVNGRTSKLFPQDGGAFGLFAVPVLESPGKYTVEVLASDNTVLESTPLTVRDAHYPSQNVVMAAQTAALQPSPEETAMSAAFRDLVSDVRFWKEPFTSPVPGCLTSRFGVLRLRNGKPTGDFHGGVDLRAPTGQPVRATAAGAVRIARQFPLRGGTVGIDHGQGLTSMYLHLSKIEAQEGPQVQAGDVIGYAGATGRANAPHLHWAIYVNGIAVSPMQWRPVAACAGKPAPKR